MDLNKVMLIGRLTSKPEVKVTQTGVSVCTLSVATNNDYIKDGQKISKPEYNDVVAWSKLADICGQYLNKGSQVYVEGRLQTRSWEDQGGNKKYRTEIIMSNMIMLDSKNGNPSGQEQKLQNTAQPSIGDNIQEIPF